MDYRKEQKRKKDLELVARFKMTPDEAKAYKISLLYRDIAKQTFPDDYIFPDEHWKKSKKVVDPRTTFLFKCCYKLLQENKLKGNEYKLYIKAQMDILKSITKDGEHPLVDPRCLISEQAWKRWLVWRKKYDELRLMKAQSVEDTFKGEDYSSTIKDALLDTKKLLTEKVEELTKEKMRQSIESRAMMRWYALRLVSPYYIVLSPLVADWLMENKYDFFDAFQRDEDLYLKDINDDLKKFFKEAFSHEF